MGVNRNGRGLVWAIVLACLAAVQALAAQEVTKPISRKQQATLSSAVFLNAHPDMKHRKQGWDAYAEGDFALARAQFLKAAWYGDKPSQAMLAEMDWKGEGAAVDRASAYTWADFAAERGYFAKRKLRYVERDISNPQNHAQWTRLGGRAVPLFVINGQVSSGFNAEGMTQRLRRLGW